MPPFATSFDGTSPSLPPFSFLLTSHGILTIPVDKGWEAFERVGGIRMTVN